MILINEKETEKTNSYITIELASYPLPVLYTYQREKRESLSGKKTLFPNSIPRSMSSVPSSDDELKLKLLFKKG